MRYTVLFLMVLLGLAAHVEAKTFAKVAKCTRTELKPGQPGVTFYILTSALNEDYSFNNDGLIVLDAMRDVSGEPASMAVLVDIRRNSDGTFTIPDDRLYGDSYGFSKGEPTVNRGKHSTFICKTAE